MDDWQTGQVTQKLPKDSNAGLPQTTLTHSIFGCVLTAYAGLPQTTEHTPSHW